METRCVNSTDWAGNDTLKHPDTKVSVERARDVIQLKLKFGVQLKILYLTAHNTHHLSIYAYTPKQHTPA